MAQNFIKENERKIDINQVDFLLFANYFKTKEQKLSKQFVQEDYKNLIRTCFSPHCKENIIKLESCQTVSFTIL
jgi:hypothetical protein